jgi:hypothetical protein
MNFGIGTLGALGVIILFVVYKLLVQPWVSYRLNKKWSSQREDDV